jgi:hypothetical protein
MVDFLESDFDEAEDVPTQEVDVKAILAQQIAEAKAAGKEYQGKK